MQQTREANEPGRAPAPRDVPAEDARESLADDAWVLCRACGALLAPSASRIDVHGSHAHAFINLAGMIFRVGCFARAPGVAGVGEESDHFTWFRGYTWQAALCRGCWGHLGWCYRRAEDAFVALILDKIVERSAPSA